jgi:hypothetical protein
MMSKPEETTASFDETFDKLVAGDLNAMEAPPVEASEPVDEQPQPETVEPEPEAEPETEAAPETEPAAEKPSSEAEDVLARLASLVKQTESKLEPKPEPEQPATEQQEPLYTPEEQQFLESYEQDWTDVSRAETLKRRVEYRGLAQYIFNEVASEFARLQAQVYQLIRQTRQGELKSAVNDYDAVMPQVQKWIETQPAYLQSAYKQVIQQGSVDDVADLVNRYRKETGGPAPTSTRKTVAELPTPAKQAVEALAPVSSERSAPAAHEPDANDFDSAFERAVAALK